MSARYYCESFLITHLCLVLSSAKERSLPVLLYSLACLKPPACYGKQMLSRLYYFSKHSYPLPCYFLWSARLAALTSPSPPLLVSATLTPASHPSQPSRPPSPILSASDQRRTSQTGSRWLRMFKIRVICHETGRGVRERSDHWESAQQPLIKAEDQFNICKQFIK